MASCTIKLRLVGDGEPATPGEPLRGEVVVETQSAVRCDGLKVSLYWRTEGKGNPDEGLCAEDLTLKSADWSPGRHVIPFSLVAPAGPPPYDGELVRVRHLLRATADVPWALDPKDELPVVIRPDGLWRSAAGDRPMQAGKRGNDLQMSRNVVLGAVICLFVPFGLFVLPLFLALMFPPSRNWLARQRVGEVTASLDAQRLSPGQPLRVALRLPNRSAPLRGVEAILRCEEIVVKGSGKHRRTHTRTVHELVTPLKEGPGEEREATIHVPETTAWSFESYSNRVEWSLVIHVNVQGWVDWIVRFPISVDPPSALAAAPSLPRLAAAPEPFVEPITPAPEPITPAPIVEPSPAPLPPAPVAPPAGDEAALAALSGAIKAASPLNDQRATLIREAAAAPLTFTLRAERIERSFGLHLPQTHRDGRTAIGTLDDGTPVAVSLQDADTAKAEALPRGARLQVTATVTGWNSLFDRLELVGALS